MAAKKPTKKKKSKRVGPPSKQATAAPKVNLFDLKSSKRKFSVLGKKIKSVEKNVVQARNEAVQRRKKTLLIEYSQLKKANQFVDRRFGENDDSLTEEEKALARLQATRVRQSKKKGGAKFNLEDDTLTHFGKSLDDDAPFDSKIPFGAGDDDMDEELEEEFVQNYHFGGGDDDGKQAADGKPKTKKQIMEEIIAKSKMYKAMKQQQKEADEDELKALDAEFTTLTQAQSFASLLKPSKSARTVLKDAGLPASTEDAQYDKAARELVFEAKGQAGERTLTAEELTERERARLEQLEKARLKRMREDELEDDDDIAGGFAARRKRISAMPSGDALEDDFEMDEDEDEDGEDEYAEDALPGVSDLEQRRRDAAAGDHPLQQAFRQTAAALMKKYGMQVEGSDGGEDEDEDGDEDEDEHQDRLEDEEATAGNEPSKGKNLMDKDGQEGFAEDGHSSGEDEHDDDEEEEGLQMNGLSEEDMQKMLRLQARLAEVDKQIAARPDSKAESRPLDENGTAAGMDDDGNDDPASEAVVREQPGASTSGRTHSADAVTVHTGLPFTIPIPKSYPQFAKLVNGRSAEDLVEAIRRIRVYNAAELATDAKMKLQVFYGILLSHFAFLAGEQPLQEAHLNAMVPVLVELMGEVPLYAATVARARMKKMDERVSAAIAARRLGEAAWPASRYLLLLKLLFTIFPTSDKRHPVSTPAALLCGKVLSHCPVATPQEAAIGLAYCGLALHIVTAAKRHSPEVLQFLATLLCTALPADVTSALDNSRVLTLKDVKSVFKVEAMNLFHVVGADSSSKEFKTDSFKASVVIAAVKSVHRAAQLYQEYDSFPESFAKLTDLLQRLLGLPGLQQVLKSDIKATLELLQKTTAAVIAKRKPVVQVHRVKAAAFKEQIPRFEEGYFKGRDYDPDRERAEQRRLKREVNKEKRGAMRELRADAVFMAAERDREKRRVDSERLQSERKFYAELQSQASDLKSGGQQGMNPHLKKKKK